MIFLPTCFVRDVGVSETCVPRAENVITPCAVAPLPAQSSMTKFGGGAKCARFRKWMNYLA